MPADRNDAPMLSRRDGEILVQQKMGDLLNKGRTDAEKIVDPLGSIGAGKPNSLPG